MCSYKRSIKAHTDVSLFRVSVESLRNQKLNDLVMYLMEFREKLSNYRSVVLNDIMKKNKSIQKIKAPTSKERMAKYFKKEAHSEQLQEFLKQEVDSLRATQRKNQSANLTLKNSKSSKLKIIKFESTNFDPNTNSKSSFTNTNPNSFRANYSCNDNKNTTKSLNLTQTLSSFNSISDKTPQTTRHHPKIVRKFEFNLDENKPFWESKNHDKIVIIDSLESPEEKNIILKNKAGTDMCVEGKKLRILLNHLHKPNPSSLYSNTYRPSHKRQEKPKSLMFYNSGDFNIPLVSTALKKVK